MIEAIAKTIYDTWSDAEVCLGGSAAFMNHLVFDSFGGGSYKPKTYNHPYQNDIYKYGATDLDIYLTVKTTRSFFKWFIQNKLFPNQHVIFVHEEGDTPGNPSYYKMPGLYRRISCYADDVPYDFIFIDLNQTEYGTLPAYLLGHQASTLSECVYEYERFMELPKMGKVHMSPPFRSIFENGIHLNTHPDVATPNHVAKIRARASELGLKITREYSQPYGDDLDHERAREWLGVASNVNLNDLF